MTKFREPTKPAFSEPVQPYEAEVYCTDGTDMSVRIATGWSFSLSRSLEDRLPIGKRITLDVTERTLIRAYDGDDVLLDKAPGVRYEINEIIPLK